MKISTFTVPAFACILALAATSCKSSKQASNENADPYGYGYGTNPYGQPEQGAYQPTNNDYVDVTPTQPSNDYASYQQQPAYSEPSYTAPAPAPAPTPSYSSSSSSKTYTVQRGDNLYRIGLNHGVNVNTLKSANGLSSDVIHPGDVLSIP